MSRSSSQDSNQQRNENANVANNNNYSSLSRPPQFSSLLALKPPTNNKKQQKQQKQQQSKKVAISAPTQNTPGTKIVSATSAVDHTTTTRVLLQNRKTYSRIALPSQYGVKYSSPNAPEPNRASVLRHQQGRQSIQIQQQQFQRISSTSSNDSAPASGNNSHTSTPREEENYSQQQQPITTRHQHQRPPQIPLINFDRENEKVMNRFQNQQTIVVNDNSNGSTSFVVSTSNPNSISLIPPQLQASSSSNNDTPSKKNKMDKINLAMEKAKARNNSTSPEPLRFSMNPNMSPPRHIVEMKQIQQQQSIESQQNEEQSLKCLAKVLQAERRRHQVLIEKQRVLLERQAQRIIYAQEIHRVRHSNCAIERNVMTLEEEQELERKRIDESAKKLMMMEQQQAEDENEKNFVEHHQAENQSTSTTKERMQPPTPHYMQHHINAAQQQSANTTLSTSASTATSSSLLLPQFPEQPQLPLNFNASEEASSNLELPERDDGGIEIREVSARRRRNYIEQMKLMKHSVENEENPSFHENVDDSFHGAHLIEKENTENEQQQQEQQESEQQQQSGLNSNNNSNILDTSMSSQISNRSLPYRRNKNTKSTNRSWSQNSSPTVTPQHLKGGIIFLDGASSIKKVSEKEEEIENENESVVPADSKETCRPLDMNAPLATTTTTTTEKTAVAAATIQQEEKLQKQSTTSVLLDTTTANTNTATDDSTSSSPLRRRRIQLETQEWMERRSIESEQLHFLKALQDGKKMSLLVAADAMQNNNSIEGKILSQQQKDLHSLLTSDEIVSLTFASHAPPLLVYDLILSAVERAAWYEEQQRLNMQQQQQNKTQTSSAVSASASASNNQQQENPVPVTSPTTSSILFSTSSGDAAAASALIPKPKSHKNNFNYYTTLWNEIKSKEDLGISTARDRFVKQHGKQLKFSADTAIPKNSPEKKLVTKIAIPSFAPYFFLPPKSVLGPLLGSECGVDIANRICSVFIQREQQKQKTNSSSSSSCEDETNNSSSNINNDVSDNNKNNNNASCRYSSSIPEEGMAAVKVVSASFRRPVLGTYLNTTTSSSTTTTKSQVKRKKFHQEQSKIETILAGGRAQLQIQTAEIQAAEDIVWNLAQLVLEKAAKKVVLSNVVREA